MRIDGPIQFFVATGILAFDCLPAFAEVEREVGNFPRATSHSDAGIRPVTARFSTDDLGMGQHGAVRGAMKTAIDTVGARLESRFHDVDALVPVLEFVDNDMAWNR